MLPWRVGICHRQPIGEADRMKYNISLEFDIERLAKSGIITVILIIFVAVVYMIGLSAVDAAKSFGIVIDANTVIYIGIAAAIALIFKLVYDNEEAIEPKKKE